jgi:membrane fusion protein, multidrug efflux system
MIRLTLTIVSLSSFFFMSCSNAETTDNAQLEADISPVISRIGGTVSKVIAQDNMQVNEGDTLLFLDDASFRIAVGQAEVALQQAKQQVVLAQSNRNAASSSVSTVSANAKAVEANIIAANAAIAAAKVKFDIAGRNFQRLENLYQQQSATQQQYDFAKAERDGAEQGLKIAEGQLLAIVGQVDASRSQIATSKTSVVTSSDNIALAELAVKQAEHNLEMAKLQLSYCVITAPAKGVISKKTVQKGQVVGVGQPLMAVTDHKNVWVIANFKETQLERMQAGQAVEISIDAYGDKTYKGKVASLSQATGAKFSLLPPDNATGNFVKVTQRVPVKILFTEDADTAFPLRAGMSVSVKVKTAE